MGEPETHFTIVCETGDGGVVCVHVLKNPMIQRKRPPPIYGGSSQYSEHRGGGVAGAVQHDFFLWMRVSPAPETAIPETAAGEGGTAPLVAW